MSPKQAISVSIILAFFTVTVIGQNPFVSPTDKGPFTLPAEISKKIFNPADYNPEFINVNNGEYKLYWKKRGPADPTQPISVTNNANLTVAMVGSFGKGRDPNHWAYMGLAFGSSMLHAQFIMARYLKGKCWLTEHDASMVYGAPILRPDQSKYLVTPIGCSWGDVPGQWSLEFSRPMVVDSKDEFKRVSLATDSINRDEILMSYQFNAPTISDFHTPNQRARFEVNWDIGYFKPLSVSKPEDKLIHGLGMMVCWLLVLPFGVFYARYFKQHKFILVHISSQTTGVFGVLVFFSYIFLINFYHISQTHNILGVVLVTFLVLQATLGIFNRLGLQFESIAAIRFVVRTIHDYLGPALLITSVFQVGLGLNIVYPYADRHGVGINARPLSAPLWYVFIAVVGVWVMLFVAMEVYFFLRVRMFDPALKFKPVRTIEKKEKDGYVPGKSFELDTLNGKREITNVAVYNATPMQKVAVLNAEKSLTASSLKKLTWKELDESINNGAMYVVANGRFIYDISQWINSHPGGQIILHTVCGTDITSDYFHEAGFDATEYLPKMKSATASQHRGKPTITQNANSMKSPKTQSSAPTEYWKTVEAVANAEYARNFTEKDWTMITKSRRPHLHTRNAIEKLASLIVGEIVTGKNDTTLPGPKNDLESSGIVRFSPDEYRRYALTDKQIVSGPNSKYKMLRLRFCLLYPFTAGGGGDEINAMLQRPFIPGECVEIQVRPTGGYKNRQSTVSSEGGKKTMFVSRYYTPINGNMIAFEIIAKVTPGGALTSWLERQSVGARQYKIRGPFGTPLLIGPEKPIAQSSTNTLTSDEARELVMMRDRVVFFTAGSGVAPFLQMLKWAVLPEFMPLEVMFPWQPTQGDELVLEPRDFVAVRTHFLDGWAFGMNLRTGEEGTFPLSTTSPAYPRIAGNASSTFLTLHHSTQTLDDLAGVELIEGGTLAYGSTFVKINLYVSGSTGQTREGVTGNIVNGRMTIESVGSAVKEAYRGLQYQSKERERPVFVICGPKAYSGLVRDGLDMAGVPPTEIVQLLDGMYL